MWPKVIRRLFAIALCMVTVNGWGVEGDRNWGVSPYLGIYNPSLELLNKGAFLSPYVGTADLIDQFGNNNNVTVPFIYRNPLPELRPGTLGGLEFQWRFYKKQHQPFCFKS